MTVISKPWQAGVGTDRDLSSGPGCRRLWHAGRRSDANRDVCSTVALLTLDGKCKEVVTAKRKPGPSVCFEMPCCVDGAADMAHCANGPELLKIGISNNGRCVDAPLHPYLVRSTVRLQGAIAGGVGVVRRVVHTH